MRDDANLLITFVTDSVDCSLGTDGATAFDPDGDRALWSAPDAPTEGICWNAGTACTGDPLDLDCQPANLGADGLPAADPEEAVLRDVQDYIDFLEDIADAKPEGRRVVPTVAGGFSPNGSVHYAVSTDAERQAEFGIGPGCHASGDPGITASPPIRLRAVADRFGRFSACDDPSQALSPAFSHTCPGHTYCYPQCVADADSGAAGVQPDCELSVEFPGEPAHSIPECNKGPDGQYLVDPRSSVPAGHDMCGQLFAGPWEPEHLGCPDGQNLRVEFVRRPEVTVPTGTRLLGRCVPTNEC